MNKELEINKVDVIKYTPPDKHSCVLYSSTGDLFEVLAPYFKAGLENNEFCIWILSEPLKIEEAKFALSKAVKDLDYYIVEKQIEIWDYKEFYLKFGTFTAFDMLKYWAKKEREVLEQGFHGMRVSGDGTWGLKEYWLSLRDYEQEINAILNLSKQHMTAICTYCVNKLELQQLLDIGTFHQTVLCKKMGQWTNLTAYDFDIATN
jgi:MEDS: MEthanogen/methylotroph, DcmR Sensory domain